MDSESHQGRNVVAWFFGGATVCVLVLILLALSSSQWQEASNPNLYPKVTINYSDPNAPDTVETQIVHNKAGVLFMFLCPGSLLILGLLIGVSIVANRRIQHKINNPVAFQEYYNNHR